MKLKIKTGDYEQEISANGKVIIEVEE